jgi:hypothetical protein
MFFVTMNLKTGLTWFTSSASQFDQWAAECQRSGNC